jgi:hypothetical protein
MKGGRIYNIKLRTWPLYLCSLVPRGTKKEDGNGEQMCHGRGNTNGWGLDGKVETRIRK